MSNGRAHHAAHLHPRDLRTVARRLTPGISVAAALAAVTLVPASSSADPQPIAEPTIEQVERRIDRLYHRSEQAQERLNTVRVEMRETRRHLRALRRDLSQEQRRFDRVRREAAALVADHVQRPAASLGATTEVLVSDDPTAFLDGMIALDTFTAHRGALLDILDQTAKRLALRRQQVNTQLTELAGDRRQIAAEGTTVEENLAEAQVLLERLEAEERARLRRIARARERAQERAQQRALQEAQEGAQEAERAENTAEPADPDPEPAPSAPTSGNGAAAVAFAMSQVGDSYVYGAAGPDAWDCSGLMMAAWAAAGVSLPHSSSAQYSSGTPVSASELQPGDLVFYYSPISHVGMYVGNGQIVHASNPSSPVGTTSLYAMPFVGAVRPG